MKLKLSALVLLILVPSMADAKTTVCPLDLDSSRDKMLESVSKMESFLGSAQWKHARYREVYYTALWDAVQMKDDRFSEKRQIDGEVLERRYRELAQVYRRE